MGQWVILSVGPERVIVTIEQEEYAGWWWWEL